MEECPKGDEDCTEGLKGCAKGELLDVVGGGGVWVAGDGPGGTGAAGVEDVVEGTVAKVQTLYMEF